MTRRALALVAVILTASAAAGMVAAHGAAARPAARIADPLRFVDTFDNGRTDGWLPRTLGTTGGRAHWAVTGGRLVQSSNVYGGSTSAAALDKPGTMYVAGDQAWTDYDYSVRARTTDDDAFGVVFRYQGPHDFYRFSMDRQRHTIRLVKRVAGSYRLVARSSAGYARGAWYALRVVVAGPHLQVYVNGRAVFDVRDGSLTHGRLGVYTWGCPTTFDDVRALVTTPDYFTIAVLPDTQYEVAGAPSLLAAQTRYLATNRAGLHLAAVLHEGDVVEDMHSGAQWSSARRYLSYLGGKVQYAVAAGNHDTMETSNSARPLAIYPASFEQLMAALPGDGTSGRFQPGSAMNSYQLLDAGGVHLIIINLAFGARDDVLQWAGQVADRYPDRHAILLTHDYLGANGLVRGPGVPGGSNKIPSSYNASLNDPIDIWNRFVKIHANVQFVFNGHVVDPTSPTEPWSVGRLVSTNDAGRAVYQTLTNYQTYRGGGGFLRLFRFYPATGEVTVTSYSPAMNTYLTGPDDRFAYTGVDLGAWPPVR